MKEIKDTVLFILAIVIMIGLKLWFVLEVLIKIIKHPLIGIIITGIILVVKIFKN
ncbi:MAG: hypothetical protein Q8911_09610 [Bacillota bacterium]|nr:hypothetical protein [Bacillota bacterium]